MLTEKHTSLDRVQTLRQGQLHWTACMTAMSHSWGDAIGTSAKCR